MVKRSENQRSASAKNGRASKGPRTAGGKATSSQNARTHGLTGTIDPDTFADDDIEALRARLAADCDPDDPIQDVLIERVLSATIKLQRSRFLLVQEIEQLTLLISPQDAQALNIAKQIRGPSDFKSEFKLSTKLTRLMRYVERFRGERDMALKKLWALTKEGVN